MSAHIAASAPCTHSLFFAFQGRPPRSLGEFVDHIGQINALRTIISSRIRRSLHSQFRLLASGLNLACARGATGQRPIDQCWRRQARACRRLCVLSAWCLCASEEKRTRVAGIYSCITLLGIASPPGSWRLGGLPEMRRVRRRGAQPAAGARSSTASNHRRRRRPACGRDNWCRRLMRLTVVSSLHEAWDVAAAAADILATTLARCSP